MAGLIYREMILNKKSLAMMAFGEMMISLLMFFPIFFADGHSETEVVTALFGVTVFFMLFLVLGMLTAGIFAIDETKKWAYFITSTPVTDAGHIKGKYIFTLLLYIVLLMWCYFLSALLAAFGGPANVLPAFEMMCMMVFVNAIEFPFLVRFGSKAGNYVKTASGLILMLIAFEFILFGNVSVFESAEKFFAFIEKLLDTSSMSDITLVLLAGFPYLSAGLYFLSYKLSCRLYLKGAEDYDG